jgi:prenyltransferase beta subunit
LAIALILFIYFSGVSCGVQNTQSYYSKNVSSQKSSNPSPSLSSPSPYFSIPTSDIRILITYDLSTGAEVYADEWRSLVTSYGYNASSLPVQQIVANTDMVSNYDLIIVDDSCGGSLGSNITLGEANALVETGKPLILLGAAHGIIDRLANYTGAMGEVEVTGIVQKADSEVSHPIFNSPFPIGCAGIGSPNSIEIFSQPVDLESYPENSISNLYAFAIIEGAPKPVIAALYSAEGTCGRIYWWAFKDPSTLTTDGMNLFVNTVEWMAGLTNIELFRNFILGTESLNASESTYWTGGFGDYFEPQISTTYYAFESLSIIRKLNAINTSDLVAWLTSYCYNSSGGYFKSPNRYVLPSAWSGVSDTGMALKILSDLGALSIVNLTKISAYIRSCQLADGFVGYPGDTSKSITNSYWALMALNATGDLAAINESKVISYILSCQDMNPGDATNYGGFANSPGGSSSTAATYMALVSLKILGALALANQALVERWLMNGYIASKGLFHEQNSPDYRPTVNYDTGYSVGSLAILGKLGDINAQLVAGYLSSVQFTDGGWSGANCTDEPIDEITDCYPVIFAFGQLGFVTAVRDIDGFVDFLLRSLCPAPTYGFSDISKTFSNTWQTYDGVSTLYNLGLLNASSSAVFYNSILSSYDQQDCWFEWSRYSFPPSSDGYSGEPYVNLPFEYSYMQRNNKGAILTDMAVTSLVELGYENWVSLHAQEIWDGIVQCEVTTGSYSGYYKNIPTTQISNLTTGLRYTYYSLDCLWTLAHYLNMTNNFQSHLSNATMTINRIMSLYDPLTGSFREDGYVIDPYSHIETTYMALASLRLLNALSQVNITKTAGFLQAHLYSNLVDTYYSFKGLQALGELAVINTTSMTTYIDGTQCPDGSFKSNQTDLYRLETTRMASEILTYYSQTWVAARQIELTTSNVQLPTTIQLGETFTANLTLIDSQFTLPVTEATVEATLGPYEYLATEAPANSGRYSITVSVPIDSKLPGTQPFIIRCSKTTYGTGITQTTVEVNKIPTSIDMLEPDNHSCVMTYNASVTAFFSTLNRTQQPVAGAQLNLYVNSSLSETDLTNSSGFLTFAWRPSASGTYDLSILFDGSDLLNASQVLRTVLIDKTPSMISIIANYSSHSPVKVGSTLQLLARLLVKPTLEPIGFVGIFFVVTTPSSSQMEMAATSGADGAATAQLTLNENGDYSIYSQFQANGYYEGSTSDSLVFNAEANVSNGGSGKAPTQIDIPGLDSQSCVMTYNVSVKASISAYNGTQQPVAGAQLHLYVNGSLSETALTGSSGFLTFAWRPCASGTYNLRVVFDGSDLLNASQASGTMIVEKTPSMISVAANCSANSLLKVGCTIQFETKLLEKPTQEPIAQVEVRFIFTYPSGSQTNLVATTDSDGNATTCLTLNQNGSYSIYSQFDGNGYYEGSYSAPLVFDVGAIISGGASSKVSTGINIVEPDSHDCVMTYNASVIASISAYNGTQKPVTGAQLHLYVNGSLAETALTNSSGFLTFDWRPNSSATYNLMVVFDGSDLLNSSQTSRTILVDKTPSMISLTSNCTDQGSVNIDSALQLEATLRENITGMPIGQVEVSFVITTPSGSQTKLITATGSDGTATVQLTLNENGSYSIYTQFATNGYYEGSTSNPLVFNVEAKTENGGGAGSSSNAEGFTWVSAILSALLTPLGAGLMIASGSLLAIAYLSKTKNVSPEISAEEINERNLIDKSTSDSRRHPRKQKVPKDNSE